MGLSGEAKPEGRAPTKTLTTRASLALLGPCFKTGHRVTTPRQSPRHRRPGTRHRRDVSQLQAAPHPTPKAEAHRGGNGARARSATQPQCRPGLPARGRLHLPTPDDKPSDAPERQIGTTMDGLYVIPAPQGTETYLPTTDRTQVPTTSQLTVQLHRRVHRQQPASRLPPAEPQQSTTTSTL